MSNFVTDPDVIRAALGHPDLYAVSDSTCTTGYDNDGSTGLAIFDDGYELGYKAAKSGLPVFRILTTELATMQAEASTPDEIAGAVGYTTSNTAWFFMGTKDQVIARLQEWR